jgi:hypothetical protein
MIGDRVMQIKQLLDQLGIKSNPMEMFLHEWRNINESKVTEMEIHFSPFENENYHRFIISLQAINLTSLSLYATDLTSDR